MRYLSGIRSLSIVLALLWLTGCKTLKIEDASPAVVLALDSQGKSEIADVINQVMPGANVILAEDILTEDNRLFIERKQTYIDGNPVQGRITEMPRKFELYRYEGRCYLVDDKTGENYLLHFVRCKSM
ncbi:hypothetical protein [Kangiella sediminilitoris]|uniref:Lipoprotein n=1 Tax=Kangiella sediminilitoris TaxID=1144748 RepID=A0A1B3BB60_9GAMM|nr:hypothetical protein [Kangiella sediminilitoris]AOE50030.1 hypothetical protein KS2013_1316 [Kangiella sediminilitoris]